MNCPVCHKILASTLSICPGCGAMMNDSIREELEVKSAPLEKSVNFERKGASLMTNKPNPVKLSEPKPLALKTITAELPQIAAEPKSAPTSLVEFQNKNAALPDWRLKMQNAARQRLDVQTKEVSEVSPSPRRTQPATNGANALKIDVMEDAEPIPFKNETVSKALKRIEESRQKFLIQVQPQAEEVENQAAQNKNYPFYIAARTNEPIVKTPEKATVNVAPKPKLVTAVRNINGDLDTNKLPPLQPKPAQMATSFDKPLTIPMPPELIQPKSDEPPISAKIKETIIDESVVEMAEEVEEVDDLAPFAMRFNAGLFDLIIGSFASLILLAPFMISGGSWFSFSGFLAFAAVTSVVMFIYMTTALGMFGKTLGMRLFSLELVDIEANDYPTFHQAAVNSSVYLLSLALGGIGFLTIPFTEEKRAVHDIVSGTIVIKED
jgi:uncharacterized RDD family membrane protein YckC